MSPSLPVLSGGEVVRTELFAIDKHFALIVELHGLKLYDAKPIFNLG
ncbi:MAG: hypothetical protein HQK70_07750 [Desulfamplus sp.]|nr:hypothetical protein [Desulfamplus sp.]